MTTVARGAPRSWPTAKRRCAASARRTSPTFAFAATPALTVRTGNSYTLALADNHRMVEIGNASAITVTVPNDSAVAFPIGARIEIAQTGAGQITVSDSGVTLRVPAGKAAKTRLQYAIIALTKRNTDEWILSGDLA